MSFYTESQVANGRVRHVNFGSIDQSGRPGSPLGGICNLFRGIREKCRNEPRVDSVFRRWLPFIWWISPKGHGPNLQALGHRGGAVGVRSDPIASSSLGTKLAHLTCIQKNQAEGASAIRIFHTYWGRTKSCTTLNPWKHCLLPFSGESSFQGFLRGAVFCPWCQGEDTENPLSPNEFGRD